MAYSTQWGADSRKFGGADYSAALYPHRRDTTALQTAREGVLSWLTGAGLSTLDPTNRPGVAGGMYEQIKAHKREKPRDLGRNWESSDVKITPWFGAADPEGTDPTSIQSERS